MRTSNLQALFCGGKASTGDSPLYPSIPLSSSGNFPCNDGINGIKDIQLLWEGNTQVILPEVWTNRHVALKNVFLLLCWCFTALRHILGHFGRGQLTYPHCSWASLLGRLPVLSAHSFANNWQLPFLSQRKGKNGRTFFFRDQIST